MLAAPVVCPAAELAAGGCSSSSGAAASVGAVADLCAFEVGWGVLVCLPWAGEHGGAGECCTSPVRRASREISLHSSDRSFPNPQIQRHHGLLSLITPHGHRAPNAALTPHHCPLLPCILI